MGRENDLFEGLARDLEAAGEADGGEQLWRWFDLGLAVTGLSAPSPPEPVRAIAATGSAEAALDMRAAQLQELWLVIAGAQAEYDEAHATGDVTRQARLLKALSMLMAVSEEESAAVHAALKAQSN